MSEPHRRSSLAYQFETYSTSAKRTVLAEILIFLRQIIIRPPLPSIASLPDQASNPTMPEVTRAARRSVCSCTLSEDQAQSVLFSALSSAGESMVVTSGYFGSALFGQGSDVCSSLSSLTLELFKPLPFSKRRRAIVLNTVSFLYYFSLLLLYSLSTFP